MIINHLLIELLIYYYNLLFALLGLAQSTHRKYKVVTFEIT